MKNLYQVKIEIKGIYEWGRGFLCQEVADIFYGFWQGPAKTLNLHVLKPVLFEERFDTSIRLCGTENCFFVHPMSVDGYFVNSSANADIVFDTLKSYMDAMVEFFLANEIRISYKMKYRQQKVSFDDEFQTIQ